MSRRLVRPARLLRHAPAAAATVVIALGLVACGSDVDSQLEEIRVYQEAGQYQDSIDPLRTLLEANPDQPEANYLLGRALVETGQPTRAVWPLRKAAGDERFAVDANLVLARALVTTRNFEEGLRAAGSVLEREPDHAEALQIRLSALYQMRDIEGTLATSDRLLEVAPGDLDALAIRGIALTQLGRREEAETNYQKLEARAVEEENLVRAAQSCVAIGDLYRKRGEPTEAGTPGPPVRGEAGRSEKAETAYLDCFREYPYEASTVGALTDYYTTVGEMEKASEVWSQAVEATPESLALRVGYANHLWLMGQREDAKALIREATELTGDARAWTSLAELHKLDDQLDEAIAAIQKARELGDSPGLRFQLAELQVRAGDLEAAEAMVEELDEPSYREFLRGRILLEQGENEEALERIEAGLSSWPNNPGARALAGTAAQRLGRPELALEHFREAVRADAASTDAGLAAARLAYQMGLYDDALVYLVQQVRARPVREPEALVLALRVADAAKRPQLVEPILAQLGSLPGAAPALAAERARLAVDKGQPAEALATLDAAGLDLTLEENEQPLRARTVALQALGRHDEALALLDEAIARRPDAASLLDLRGRVLNATDRLDEAQRAFERALAVDDAYGPALAGLGVLAQRAGRPEAAIDYFDRAAAADEDEGESAYRAAQLVLASGDLAGATDRLRQVTGQHPDVAGAANDLAWILASQERELDQALGLALRAARVKPVPAVIDTLAYVRLQRGEVDAAIEVLQESLAKFPNDSNLRYRLGVAQLETGNSGAALSSFQQALAGGPFPEADAARAAIARLRGE